MVIVYKENLQISLAIYIDFSNAFYLSSSIWFTIFHFFISSTSINLPVKISSLAKYFPIVFDIIVPPKLGNTPSFTSGNPNLVPLTATITLHYKANSKPPPKASLLTHAIIGLLKFIKVYLITSNGSYKLFSIYVLFWN